MQYVFTCILPAVLKAIKHTSTFYGLSSPHVHVPIDLYNLPKSALLQDLFALPPLHNTAKILTLISIHYFQGRCLGCTENWRVKQGASCCLQVESYDHRVVLVGKDHQNHPIQPSNPANTYIFLSNCVCLNTEVFKSRYDPNHRASEWECM